MRSVTRTRILRKALIRLRECSRPAIERNAAAQQKADLASRVEQAKLQKKLLRRKEGKQQQKGRLRLTKKIGNYEEKGREYLKR